VSAEGQVVARPGGGRESLHPLRDAAEKEERMSDNVITPGPEPVLLPLGSLRREDTLWPRKGLIGTRVWQFARLHRNLGETALPPILVCEVAGRDYLGDGWHRCAAAERMGWSGLPAIRKRAARLEDVYVEAVSASATNPQPFTPAEKRAAVDRLLAMKLGYSDHCLARLVGVSQPFVSGRRKRWEQAREEGSTPSQPLSPAQRQARKLIRAVLALRRLAADPRHYSEGAPIDPVAELWAAAQACRDESAAAIVAELERWARRLRRETGEETPD
jgi:hypothetical protein